MALTLAIRVSEADVKFSSVASGFKEVQ